MAEKGERRLLIAIRSDTAVGVGSTQPARRHEAAARMSCVTLGQGAPTVVPHGFGWVESR